MFNILSFIFGSIALFIPIAAFIAKKKDVGLCTYLSLGTCSLCILFQIFEYNRRVFQADWVGLLDTSQFVVIFYSSIVICIFILNIILLKKAEKK